jgi:hypothetical protein
LPAIIACPRRPRPPGEVEWKIELIKRVLAIRLALTMLSSNFMASSRTLSLLKPYRSTLLDNFRTLRSYPHLRPQQRNKQIKIRDRSSRTTGSSLIFDHPPAAASPPSPWPCSLPCRPRPPLARLPSRSHLCGVSDLKAVSSVCVPGGRRGVSTVVRVSTRKVEKLRKNAHQ